MHRYFTAALAMILATAAIWLSIVMVGSFWHFSFYTTRVAATGVLVRSNRGVLSATGFSTADWLPTFREPLHWSAYFAGFGIENRAGVTAPIYTVYVPHWFLAGLLLLYPIRWARRTDFWLTQTRQRSVAGQCLGCGYDLRMHASGDKCPECGVVVPSKRTPK
jgi:hypothetical protein